MVAWARRALDFDRLDALVLVALGLICYGVAALYSWPHAAIAAGCGLLAFAVVGVVWRLMPPRRSS